MRTLLRGFVVISLIMLILVGCSQVETTNESEKVKDQKSNEQIEEINEEEILKQTIVDFYNYYPDGKYIVSVDQVKDHLEGNFVLDVRPRESFVKGHLPGAINIPLKEIGERYSEIPDNKQVLVICTTGQSAAQTSGILNVGGKEAVSLSGGFKAWEQAGLKIEK